MAKTNLDKFLVIEEMMIISSIAKNLSKLVLAITQSPLALSPF
ncbi:hypothetical protein [Staphylococcus pseudintermedius]|nr:hypothetical protein [Staphylococcus pseudintermedius]